MIVIPHQPVISLRGAPRDKIFSYPYSGRSGKSLDSVFPASLSLSPPLEEIYTPLAYTRVSKKEGRKDNAPLCTQGEGEGRYTPVNVRTYAGEREGEGETTEGHLRLGRARPCLECVCVAARAPPRVLIYRIKYTIHYSF